MIQELDKLIRDIITSAVYPHSHHNIKSNLWERTWFAPLRHANKYMHCFAIKSIYLLMDHLGNICMDWRDKAMYCTGQAKYRPDASQAIGIAAVQQLTKSQGGGWYPCKLQCLQGLQILFTCKSLPSNIGRVYIRIAYFIAVLKC